MKASLSVIEATDIWNLLIAVSAFGWMILMSKPKAGVNKGPKPKKVPQKLPELLPPWWKRHWKATLAIVTAVVAVTGFASSLVTFLPRPQMDVSPEYVSGSPFPASVKITNQLWPLSDVSFVVRICSVQNAVGGKIIGLKDCGGASSGGGGFTTPQWQKHRLRTDETWIVYVGGNIGINMGVVSGDVRMVLRYWPWLIPQLWFSPREVESRVVLYTKPDGSRVWGSVPVD